MKINYIKLQAEKDYNFLFNSNLTIISDYSGKGKTLLFKLIEYVLGSKGTHIELDEARKAFPGLIAIEMSIEKDKKEYVFNKTFENNKEIVYCEQKKMEGKYNDILNKIINYNPVKVIKSNSEMELTTFTLREYIKTLFFNEARLTSDSPLVSENFTERTKIKNFYKYLVTGISIDEKIILDAKMDVELENQVKTSLNVLKKELEQPTSEDKKRYKNLKTKIQNQSVEIDKESEKIRDLNLQKNEKLINIERLISLQQLFESQIEDIVSAKQFEHFLKDYTIDCECGRKINLIKCGFYDDEYKRVKIQLSDVANQIKKGKKEVDLISLKVAGALENLEGIKKEKEKSETEFSELTKNIEDYDLYVRLTNLFDIKNKKRGRVEELKKEQEQLDIFFKQEIETICKNATLRLKKWEFEKYYNVSFDAEKFDFRYDGTLRYLLSKGYRNICTCAVLIEILLKSISLGINTLNAIVIDSFWSHLYIEGKTTQDVINPIVKDLETLPIQVIVLENNKPSIYTEKTSLLKIEQE